MYVCMYVCIRNRWDNAIVQLYNYNSTWHTDKVVHTEQYLGQNNQCSQVRCE